MSKVLIKNIGKVVTGDIFKPTAEANCIVTEGSSIVYVGMESDLKTNSFDVVIDASGMTAIPGLIDSHVHPVFGDYTPKQNASGYIANYLHGGTTSMISNGGQQIPGRPRDVAGLKALAVLAAKSYQNFRPAGVKVHGGTLLLEEGFSEEDFAEVSREGVKLGKFLYEIDVNIAVQYVAWAHKYNMKTILHCGGTSIPGGLTTDVNDALKMRPDVLAHLNGGPIAMALEDINTLIHETSSIIDIVICGNPKMAVYIIKKAISEEFLERIILGTDTPTGSGIISMGMWQLIILLTCFAGLKPEQTICLATGNTGKFYNLNAGILNKGYAADIILLDASYGTIAADALSSIALGDIPGIAMIMIDGEVVVERSRITSPARRDIKIDR